MSRLSLNVGSLIAYLDLDSDNFDRKTKSANKQIDSLALNMDALGKLRPELKLATEKAAAKAQALKDELARLKLAMASAEDPAEIRVEVAATLMKLAAVKAEIRAIHREAAVPITVEFDKSKLQQLSSDLDGISTKLKGLGGAGGLFGTALAFGPALAPFGGAALGLLGSIGAGALDAAGAVGVLVAALKTVSAGDAAYTTYQQAVAKANQTYQLAVQNGGSAKSLASAAKTRNNALSNAQFSLNQSAYGKLSTAGQQFVQYDVNSVQPFKQQLSRTVQGGVLPGLTQGLHGLIADAPQVNGALASISSSVGNLLAEAGHALQSPFWKQWITWFGKDSAKNVGTMGHATGQFLEALARMDQRSGGATTLVGEVDRLATKLNRWSASPAFLSFLEHIRKDESEASQALHALWTDLDPILKGVAATGGIELQLITGALSTISKLPTGYLEVAGRVLPAIFLAMKFAPAAGAVSKELSLVTGALGNNAVAADSLRGHLRLLSGAGGLGLLLDGASRASEGMGTLESAVGGAIAGASFGPIGAAVGGIGGGLIGFISAMNHTSTAAKIAAADVNFYAGTLTASGSANTDAAKQKFVSGLTPTQLSAAKSAGITAGLGNAGVGLDGGAASRAIAAQLAKVQAAMANAAPKFGLNGNDAEYISNGGTATTSNEIAYARYLSDLRGQKAALESLNTAIAQGNVNLRAQEQQLWANTQQTTLFHTAIKGLPSAAVTKIEASDVTPTIGNVVTLLTKYHQVPAKIQTVLQALGYDTTLAQIASIQKSLNDLNGAKAIVSVTGNLWGFGPTPAATPKPKVGHNASGTNFWEGGLTWLNEQGPELVNLPRGSQVIPHMRTQSMLNEAARNSGPISLDQDTINRLAKAMATHAASSAQNQIDNTLVGLGY